jgi:hypothetical protein
MQLRRIKMVLGVAAAMAMTLVAFVAPAMAQTNEFNDSEQYDFVISGDGDWNDHNDWNDWNDYNNYNNYYYYNDEYLEDIEDAYEDYVDEVEDYEGSYLGFNSYSW